MNVASSLTLENVLKKGVHIFRDQLSTANVFGGVTMIEFIGPSSCIILSEAAFHLHIDKEDDLLF